MIRLQRRVRITINEQGPSLDDPTSGGPVPFGPTPGGPTPSGQIADGRAISNGFAGVPAMHGLGRHYELVLTVLGEINPVSAYLMDIKDLDAAARQGALPILERACREHPGADVATILAPMFAASAEIVQRRAAERRSTARLASLRLQLTPTYAWTLAATRPMLDTGSSNMRAMLRQQFDFAASHRLHVPTLSDEQNRALFGKCNNPGGHGHNYRVEAVVEVALSDPPQSRVNLHDLERAVHDSIIERFDHMYLNVDVPEFRQPGGVNPSVEEIARVCYEHLKAALDRGPRRGTLRELTVWETDRTSATFSGSALPPGGSEHE
ncbi:MAG: 6-carboxytetrahydropterin synthase [Planctomycetota bacterium]|nr:6-carboxytetrahydropterin synthase [Planctomycetota bacterium]